jgi:hypothetical protein
MLFPTKKRDPELYPYRHGLYFAFYNGLNWQAAIGTPTVLFMQQLGANSLEVGLVVSWAFLLTPVQVLATAFLPRFGYKRLTMAGWSARGWCLLVPIGLAVLAPSEPVPWMIYAMVTATFVYSLIRAVGTSSLTTWFYHLIPESIHGRYWASDQMTSGVAIVSSLLLYALLFTVLPLYHAFIILYSIAVFGAWMAYRQLKVLPEINQIGKDRFGNTAVNDKAQCIPNLPLDVGAFVCRYHAHRTFRGVLSQDVSWVDLGSGDPADHADVLRLDCR